VRFLPFLLLLPALAFSAPAIDASSASAADNTVDFNWTHTPSGTPTALFVFVGGDASASDFVNDVTYNSVSLTEHASSPWCMTNSCLHVWYTFSPPSGAQTVAVDITSSNSHSAVAYTFTGTSLQIQNTESISATSGANPSGTLTLSSTTSAVVSGVIEGHNLSGNVTALTNWTIDRELDNGGSHVYAISYDIVGSSDVTTGYTASDEWHNIVSIGLSESGASIAPIVQQRQQMQ
jgi:hypothetical protein